ncbi:MAG: sugar phosphate isomerase/epimerase [Actinomycetota bacterium]
MASPAPAILFSSAAFFGRPLADTVDAAASAGFSGIEILVTKDPDSQDPHRMRKLADEAGLTIGALHAPCLLLTRRVWSTDPVRKIYRSIEVAQEAGIPLVVVHPPFRWQREYQGWLEERLAGLEERTGITVALENMFPLGKTQDRPGLTLHASTDIHELDGLEHLVLDTSHAAVSRHDLVPLRRMFGDRLRHVHLSDNAGRGWDSHLPPGRGVLPIDDFLRDLSTSGYPGAITLEVDLRRYLSDPAALRTLMTDMRERCEAALRTDDPISVGPTA